jgi:hypothetical protein
MKSIHPLVCAALLTLAGAANAQVSVYVSPNDIETAEDSGIVGVSPSQIFTENFNSLTVGQSINGYTSSTIGATFTTAGGSTIKANDIYGGYGEGNYLAITKTNSTTMTLSGASKYFGFYFTAGDSFNVIELYSGNTLVLSFSTSSLIAMLPRNATTKITAINGSQYNTINYYGQPSSNSNSTEPYAYIHFVASGSTSFDKIVVRQSNATQNQIFESDNYSILTAAPTLPGTLVVVPIPEVSSGLMLSGGLGTMLLLRRRRH